MKKTILFWTVFVFFAIGANIVLAAPPTDFLTTPVISSGLQDPVTIEFAPDGRIFILERAGGVRIYKNNTLLSTPFVTLPTLSTGDRGLIGIAFDPNFTSNKWVYFYFTKSDQINRVVRYDATGDVASGDPVVIYQAPDISQQLHVGGTIAFGPDGKLYVAIGDNGYPPNAQDLKNPYGKILRLNADGTIPSDNPFFNTPNSAKEIYAYGLRNPWRFQFDSLTGRLYGGDVGASTWEEVNLIESGKNYGWPTCEGTCNTPGMTNPIYTYNHNGISSSITGGPVYRGSMFPSSYVGRLFFGDYAQGFIKTLQLDANGQFVSVSDFDTSVGSVVDLKTAPDGSLYYLTIFPGRLYRVTHSAANQLPIAISSASPETGQPPLTVSFSSTGSQDPNNDPLTYFWNFGDGNTSTEPNPSHTYTQSGAFTVDLTVNDGSHTTQAAPLVIQVGLTPTVNIGTPLPNSTYKAGDTINFTVSAQDGAGNDINDASIKTTVIFHHHTHTHPFIDSIVGRVGSFTIPTTGEPDPDTWYEIKSSATDTSGLFATQSINIHPLSTQLTLSTNISGLTLLLDGSPLTTPHTSTQLVNFSREVSAPSPQTINGNQYEFVSWSDNQAQAHFFSIPQTNSTLSANFQKTNSQPGFTGYYYPNLTLSGDPSLTKFDSQINFNWGTSAPGNGLPQDNFSTRWIGVHNFSSGNYTFTVTADDGVRLYVDNLLVIDKWRDQSATTYSATQNLTSGDHQIKLEYYDSGWDATAQLSWVQNTQTSGFQANFFNNQTLTGNPVLSRTDSAINFNWGTSSPGPGVNTDHFSARWEGDFDFASGSYTFTLTADDGVRLYIDNQLVLNKWIDQSATTYIITQQLTAGTHRLRLEYYENGYDARASLGWAIVASPTPTLIPQPTSTPVPTPTSAPTPTPTASPQSTFTGEYFSNLSLSGSPALTRTDSAINFNWALTSPAPQIPQDNFSVRWTGQFIFSNAPYAFTVTGDDGVRLYIDNQLVIDKWIDQSASTYTTTKPMTAGQHELKMEYFERGYDAVAKLLWTPVSTTFQGEYFSNSTLTGSPTLTRTDNLIDFNWGTSAPEASLPADKFSVRWTSNPEFTAGNHTFTVTADDGVRLYIDNQLVLDKWIDQSVTTFTITRNLASGSHNIRLEYYENGYDAVAKLSWN
jgi:glucose/arabinose dehydrogenase